MPVEERDPAPAAEADPDTAPACEKCGFATDATACPKCGWYPSLALFVEIDEAFEAVTRNLAAALDDDPQADEPPARPSELRQAVTAWRTAVPPWAWAFAATTAGVIGVNIALRFAATAAPASRALISVTELLAGLSIACAAHIVCFALQSADDADLGLFDLVLRPFKPWARLAADLPRRLWLLNTANGAATAALAAVLIVGGVPFERLLDWNIKARATPSLVGAIVAQAGPADDGGSLEGAIGDFTDSAALAGDDQREAEPAPRRKLDCLIFGYRQDAEGRLAALLLAAERAGGLEYIGVVRPRLDAEESARLVEGLSKLPATRPIVRTSQSANWVQARFACRATYTEWPRDGRPKDLRWDELLEQLKLPW